MNNANIKCRSLTIRKKCWGQGWGANACHKRHADNHSNINNKKIKFNKIK